jgi:hypothetical protein
MAQTTEIEFGNVGRGNANKRPSLISRPCRARAVAKSEFVAGRRMGIRAPRARFVCSARGIHAGGCTRIEEVTGRCIGCSLCNGRLASPRQREGFEFVAGRTVQNLGRCGRRIRRGGASGLAPDCRALAQNFGGRSSQATRGVWLPCGLAPDRRARSRLGLRGCGDRDTRGGVTPDGLKIEIRMEARHVRRLIGIRASSASALRAIQQANIVMPRSLPARARPPLPTAKPAHPRRSRQAH